MGEWISVKDRLPENGAHVLVYCHDDPYTTIASYCETEGYGCFREIPIGHGYIYYHDVSHWQPLPAPPVD